MDRNGTPEQASAEFTAEVNARLAPQKRADYWDTVIARLESSPQSNFYDRFDDAP